MIKIFADGVMTYDSRLKQPGLDYSLLGLKTVSVLNKGGTAEILMPPGHPAYDCYISLKTIVEIFRDDVLRWRGRVLYPKDDMLSRRTVLCEGELCFFRDGVSRPYLYQDSPANVFTAVVNDYNAQVEPFKQFRVGEITVTDSNDYIRLESTKAEQSLDTLNKLLDRCGGYFIFTTADDGMRKINWYAELNYASTQVIELGSNLLDFSRTGSNTDLVTGIVPYGEKDETTGVRVGIAGVNGGLDYITDPEAVALRGTILVPVYWDDVSESDTLLKKARQYLQAACLAITSLTLTAVDLSRIDRSIDSFKEGDAIRVKSPPHGLDATFRLIEKPEDWLNLKNSSITLGRDTSSLTGASAADNRKSQNDLQRAQQDITADYKLNTAQAVQASEKKMETLVQQASTEILLRVAETKQDLTEIQARAAALELTAEGLSVSVSEVKEGLDDKADRATLEEVTEHFLFKEDGLTIFNSATGMGINVSEQQVAFTGGADPTTVITPTEMETTNLRIGRRLDVGDFAWIPRTNGNLSLRYTGG